MKLTKTALSLTAIAALSLPFSIKAATIEFYMIGNSIQNPNGTNAAIGDTVEVGTFTSGFNFAANTSFAALSAAFTNLGSTTIADSSGEFDSGTVTYTGAQGLQLYIWAFNNATPSSASAWAIVTNSSSSWLTPAGSNPLAQTTIGANDAGTFVPSGAAGVVLSNSNVKMSSVPEPSSIALLGSGLLMAGSMIRRRK